MKSHKVLFTALTVIVFLFLSFSKAYSNDVFWFVFISDPHVGAEDRKKIPFKTGPCEDDSNNLHWLVNDCYKEINPKFIVNAGDLTEQLIVLAS